MGLAFLLGLMGGLSHCVGMCSGVTLLISRRGGNLFLAHVGRIITYSLLGLGAGAVGHVALGHASSGHTDHATNMVFPGLALVQGGLALAVAALAGYLALALIGRAPSPEVYLTGLTRYWGRAWRKVHSVWRPDSSCYALCPLLYALLLGLLWGLLPCPLVLTALLTAAATGTPGSGALTMLAFGLGTWPALLAVGAFGRMRLHWPRQAAALVVTLFGIQMALRGLAAWGWVSHLQLGSIMLW